jgi:hypothetical protein
MQQDASIRRAGHGGGISEFETTVECRGLSAKWMRPVLYLLGWVQNVPKEGMDTVLGMQNLVRTVPRNRVVNGEPVGE